MLFRKKLLIILGPTAIGKTDLAIEYAKRFNGELVACDSRQVYRGLDVGTGKLPSQNSQIEVERFEDYWIMGGVKVWMYDVVGLKKEYSVKDYIDRATEIIGNITANKKLPIVVGGGGFYLKGLLFGVDSLGSPADKSLRASLEKLTPGQLQDRLGELSPTLLVNLNNSEKNNKRRLIRKIELLNMYPYIDTNKKATINLSSTYDALIIGLSAPRSFINHSIDRRLVSRFSQGLVAEGKRLVEEGVTLGRMRELGLEYRCLADFFDGKLKESELLDILKNKNHQYAKRQMTYFRGIPGVNWFDVTADDGLKKMERLLTDWYNTAT